MSDTLPWIAKRTTIIVFGILALVGAVGQSIWLQKESARNDRMRAEAVEILREEHRKILEMLYTLRDLGLVETWGPDWKTKTVHSSNMSWPAFAELHDFHVEVAKP
jgi:hypothetical protein